MIKANQDVGDLPTILTEEQLQELNDAVSGNEIGHRLLRDQYLEGIDPDGYYVNQERVLYQYGADSNMVQLIADVDNEREEYYHMLLRAAEEYIYRLDISSNNMKLVQDLINPVGVPNEYNIHSRQKMTDIMSALYQVNMRDLTVDRVISPYELLLQLYTLTTTSGTATVFFSRYSNAYPMIIKTVPSDENSATLIHEYLIGTVVNRLRTDIPNFMYTYGLTRNAVINTVRNTAYYTSKSEGRFTLALEYIGNAINLHELPLDKIAQVVINNTVQYYARTNMVRLLLFQIYCSMIYAYHKIGFIHRDSHLGNILLVTLPTIMAVPIMVPVSYDWTDNEKRQVNIQFERRWILTNLMVVFVDYGLSSVDAVHLHSEHYKYDYLISPISIYSMYEGLSAFENDLMITTLALARRIYSLYLPDYREDVRNLSEDFLRILYTTYTGDVLDEDQVSERQFFMYYNTVMDSRKDFNYFQTHPLIKYDPFGAIIDYCNRYSDLFLSTDYTGYTNILSRSDAEEAIAVDIVDTREYYWYLEYQNVLSELDIEIDYEIMLNNRWYRDHLLANIMPTAIYNSTTSSNEWIIREIFRYIGRSNLSAVIIAAIYRYILYFSELKLNISPLTYEEPVDLLDDLNKFLRNNPGINGRLNSSVRRYLRRIRPVPT